MNETLPVLLFRLEAPRDYRDILWKLAKRCIQKFDVVFLLHFKLHLSHETSKIMRYQKDETKSQYYSYCVWRTLENSFLTIFSKQIYL